MIELASNKKQRWITAFAVFSFFSIYYYLMIVCNPPVDIRWSDIHMHAAMAHSFVVNHDNIPPNFLYDFLIALMSGFSNQQSVYYIASIILLSIAVTAKFLVTHGYLLKYAASSSKAVTLYALAMMMLFVFPLPGLDFFQKNNFYLGQLPPNVWHNPTVILVMPFAVLLFFKSYELLFEKDTEHNRKLLIQIAILIAVNALIKPSFLFTLIPSVLIIFGYNKFFLFKNARNKYTQLLPYLFGIFFVSAEYYVIYQLNYTNSTFNSFSNTDGHSSIIVAPFEVWKAFSSNIFIAMITSLFFPLSYIFVAKGSPFKNTIVQFAIVNFSIAYAIWVLFAEEGGREFHGNFIWQVVITTYLLFFSLLLNFIREVELKHISHKNILIIGGAFLLHFIWGIVYWLKIINSGYL